MQYYKETHGISAGRSQSNRSESRNVIVLFIQHKVYLVAILSFIDTETKLSVDSVMPLAVKVDQNNFY